jgi:SAM-dependent methyltransferase
VIDDADRRRWAAAAERYGSGWTQANAPDLGWLVEAVRPTPGDRAIDVGTGAGHAARALAPHVASVTAVDPTPEMLAVAQRLTAEAGVTGIAFAPGTAESLPVRDGSMDIAISRYSVHHWPDPAAAFREIARVLRPGGRGGAGGPGRLAIVDMVAPESGPLDTFVNAVEILRDPSHARSLRATEWIALLEAAGIEASVERGWQIRHDTEGWMAQTDPPEWRRDAVRHLLREAPAAAREAFGIETDGSAFSVGVGLIVGTLRG